MPCPQRLRHTREEKQGYIYIKIYRDTYVYIHLFCNICTYRYIYIYIQKGGHRQSALRASTCRDKVISYISEGPASSTAQKQTKYNCA